MLHFIIQAAVDVFPICFLSVINRTVLGRLLTNVHSYFICSMFVDW